jgi:DNA-binding NarL/FixJ family response regulator
MSELPKIVIVDKSPIIRSGLQDLIERDGRFNVAQSLVAGQELLDYQLENAVDIAIIGWSLSDMTGGQLLQKLKAQKAETRVIVYTGERASDVLRSAILVGAWGFISKSDEPKVLLDTLSSVANGRLCFPFVDIEKLTVDPFESLTRREKELLAALAEGWTNMQIATRTGISRNTVKYHLKNLYDKLGVNNRAMAVALFVQNRPSSADF